MERCLAPASNKSYNAFAHLEGDYLRQIIFLSALCFVFFAMTAAVAAPNEMKGFVQISNGRKLYVDWIKAQPGKDTLVLLNGLTYETTSWNQFVQQFQATGYGIFRYDPVGMGQTLAAYGPVQAPIMIENQAMDLNLLTNAVGLTGKLNLLGLSYGGGLAIVFAGLYPQRIGKAILMCPYTEVLASQDSMIKQEIAATRLTYPLNPATDEELYAYFLRQIVYFDDPIAEPSMLNSPLKPEAVFQMTQGLRKYNVLRASQNFPAGTVHLVMAGQDQYIPRQVLMQFWNQLPPASRMSRMLVDLSEHKIPEAYPVFAARWVDAIMKGQDGTQAGKAYEANPITGQIVPSSP